MMGVPGLPSGTLIVVPTLNEARTIAPLLAALEAEAQLLGDTLIVVVDGGSSDGTASIVRSLAKPGHVEVLHNPKRIQSAGINQAVAAFAGTRKWLIRIDAHGGYPSDYCRTLVAEAERMNASAVVVPMTTVGRGLFQRAVAAAQNSLVGTGGSSHRTARGGAWVDHGHHALMDTAAFRAVGGYDENFMHNEDAELDYRLRRAGGRIWLTDRTAMTYYPRSNPAALFRQYFGYGRGRARNVFKHRTMPRVRQLLPLAIVPSLALAALALLHWSALVPLAAWMALCLLLGALATTRHVAGSRVTLMSAPLVGVAAMIMHLAWSAGFWLHVVETLRLSRS
jgi:succinoglycan biosynthesis protein ExoA